MKKNMKKIRQTLKVCILMMPRQIQLKFGLEIPHPKEVSTVKWLISVQVL